ncbi:ATP-binding protein [Mesorhizobium captivum]|uniref:ATP-binding protein n=1 Tax=Mesorhizobium captivum TaxID=3072319 RepID=UPI002A24004E|nr:ATP-binding protein [Mesorhizobium sp. VK3C]MDX8449633.1 ATP-binding protein [Mesorhizobium sp. VK3C]
MLTKSSNICLLKMGEVRVMSKVIYVTGAPAAGKSSTLQALRARIPGMEVWEYGERLTSYVRARSIDLVDQSELRAKSAQVVTPDDIVQLDGQLLEFVELRRGKVPVLIDSHPVTKEEYGFRITAFSENRVRDLAPDEIWVFFTSPEETRRRIQSESGGRPLPSEEEARMHTSLQASIAATYGIIVGAPVYLFDTAIDQETLLSRLTRRFE